MIYLDHHATTPCSKKVIKTMNHYHELAFSNIDSIHRLGQETKDQFLNLEKQVLTQSSLGDAKLVYTSGATESINIAHLGLLEHCKRYNKQIISTQIEHKATLNVLKYMQRQGVDVEYLKVNAFGRINLNDLEAMLKKKSTALLSFIQGNNEIGILQDGTACIELAKKYGAWVHVDISQYLCVLDSLKDFSQADMLSFSGHKIYGPKGAGGLILNSTSSKRVPLKPIMHGGGEIGGNLKPGTHPTALAAGLCEAILDSFQYAQKRRTLFLDMKHYFLESLAKNLDAWQITAGKDNVLPHNIHLNFDHLSQDLIKYLRQIAVSSGSTCNASNKNPSHVLKALGMADARALSSIRLGLGEGNTKEHMDIAVNDITQAVQQQREKTRF